MNLALEPTLHLLRAFSGITPKTIASDAEKQSLRQAIVHIVTVSDAQNFGICADTVAEALQALNRYLSHLGYNTVSEISSEYAPDTAIYLKYSSQKASYYIDRYEGDYRGVLLSCQGSDEVTGTYGYFPLNLFND